MRELEFPQAFGLVPWGHHIDIIEHCQSIDEALFYIKKTIEGGWSRNGYHKGHLRFVDSLIRAHTNTAIAKVNAEQLQMYWEIGGYISQHLKDSSWGDFMMLIRPSLFMVWSSNCN